MASDSSIPPHKLAVLIDADNAQHFRIGPLLSEVARYGTICVKRAYGDWTGAYLNGWRDQLLQQAIQPIQQFAYTQSKNATDSAMIIDAMDLLHTQHFDGFCLVSSDSDFTRLAVRIREAGLNVYGFGEAKTPRPFVMVCNRFFRVENLVSHEVHHEGQPAAHPATHPAVHPATQPAVHPTVHHNEHQEEHHQGHPLPVIEFVAPHHAQVNRDSQLAARLRSAVEASPGHDHWAELGSVGHILTHRHPDFDSRNYGYHKFSDLITATSLFDVRREGRAVYVRDKRQAHATSN